MMVLGANEMEADKPIYGAPAQDESRLTHISPTNTLIVRFPSGSHKRQEIKPNSYATVLLFWCFLYDINNCYYLLIGKIE